MGALLPAVEDRLKALVLVSPGLYMNHHKPEADQIKFVPRVTAPVLMLNGRFDSFFRGRIISGTDGPPVRGACGEQTPSGLRYRPRLTPKRRNQGNTQLA